MAKDNKETGKQNFQKMEEEKGVEPFFSQDQDKTSEPIKLPSSPLPTCTYSSDIPEHNHSSIPEHNHLFT